MIHQRIRSIFRTFFRLFSVFIILIHYVLYFCSDFLLIFSSCVLNICLNNACERLMSHSAKKKLLTEKKEKKVMLCNGKGIGATPPGRPINGYCDKRKRRWSNAALSLTQILYLVRSSTWYF